VVALLVAMAFGLFAAYTFRLPMGAYTFEPHGTTFLAPLVVTQDLRNTDARTGGLINPLSLFVGYFPDNNKVLSVTELLNVGVKLLRESAVFTVTHFSG
jgi:hypothetical protein